MRPRPLPRVLQVDWGLGRPAGMKGLLEPWALTQPRDGRGQETLLAPSPHLSLGQCEVVSILAPLPSLGQAWVGQRGHRCWARAGGRGCTGPASEAGPPHTDPWSWECPVQARWRVE